MKNKSLLGSALLTLTAFIWGCAFVAQSVGMDYVSPLMFNGTRCILAGLVLLAITFLFDLSAKKKGTYKEETPEEKKSLLKGGAVCGIVLFVASTVQQYGIAMTTVGKAGFISVLYILIVPFLGLFLKQKLPKKIWLCSFIALVGMYFLCMSESLSLSRGDFVVFLSAAAYAVHILCVDHYVSKVANVIRLSCLQFIFAGSISLILIAIFEKPDFSGIYAAWLPIVYAGVLSGAGGYTLQIIAQKWTPPSVASLCMSLESVFAVLAGAVILGQIPTVRELLGCALMFAAIIIIQLPQKEKVNSTDKNGAQI